ncbi:MAG: hypothetical protein ERJ69_04400, partial [Aphanocapsa feldmannii 288cV]
TAAGGHQRTCTCGMWQKQANPCLTGPLPGCWLHKSRHCVSKVEGLGT